MEGSRFDNVTRTVARSGSRRGFLAGLAALAAGLAGRPASAQAQCGNVICYNRSTRTVDTPCNAGCVCCVYGNGNSRCQPSGSCTGTVVSPTTTAVPTTTTTTTLAPGTCPAGSSLCDLDGPGGFNPGCCGAGSYCGACVGANCFCCPNTAGTCIHCAPPTFGCCSSADPSVCTCCAGSHTCSNGVCS